MVAPVSICRMVSACNNVVYRVRAEKPRKTEIPVDFIAGIVQAGHRETRAGARRFLKEPLADPVLRVEGAW